MSEARISALPFRVFRVFRGKIFLRDNALIGKQLQPQPAAMLRSTEQEQSVNALYTCVCTIPRMAVRVKTFPLPFAVTT